jgi:amino acid transporter
MESITKDPCQKSLKPNCLSFVEVLGQSIANIAPSAGAALFIPATFAVSTNGTWLTFVFSTIAVVLVGYHVNHFAKKSASPGALYTFVTTGLGEGAGFATGIGLIIAYLLTASAVLAGFSNYANVLLGYIGIHVPNVLLLAIAVVSAWFVTYKDVKVSARLMLIIEASSIALILILVAVVMIHAPHLLDMTQLKLKGTSFNSITSGLVLGIFSYVGFESATALGTEAKNPLHNIPRAVILSGICIGIFYTLISYVESLGFIGSPVALNESNAPLKYLAEHNGIGILGLLVTVGCVVSFWSCAVACITAGSRILLSMGQKEIIHSSFGKVHQNNGTPHVAATVLAIVVFISPSLLFLAGQDSMNVFSWLATIATFGFLLAYFLIVVASPVFLRKRGELKLKDMLITLLTIIVLLIPIVGSIYPIQPFPLFLFPIIFAALVVVAMLYYFIKSSRKDPVSEEVS